MRLAVFLTLCALNANAQKIDEFLISSQFSAVGSGTALAIARTARYRADGTANTTSVLAVTGAAVSLERVLDRRMSRKTKIWVAIANLAASALMSTYAEKDAAHVRTVIAKLPGGYAP